MTLLVDVCLAIVDCEHKTAPKAESGYPLIRTTDIGRGRLDLSDVQRVDEPTYEEWTRRAVPQPGDLVLAREAPVGNVAMITPGLEPVLGQRTVLIRPDPDQVDPDFLCYRLLAHDIQHWMSGVANGATVPHLNMEDIRGMPLPELPPLDQQRRIGAVLGAIDDLIENGRRRIELLEVMARLIYREWFVHFRFPGHEEVELVDSPLGPIPDGWDVGTLGDVVEEVRQNATPSERTASLPYVPIEVIDRGQITLAEWRPGKEAQSSLRLFRDQDVLFGAMRAYFHKVCIAPFDGVTRSTCFVLRPYPERYTFSALLLADATTVAYAAAHSSGSTIPYAKWAGVLEKMPCVIPSLSVCQEFAVVVDPMLGLARNLAMQNRLLGEARDLLLPRLVSGELDVSEFRLDLHPVA